jgi:hypothetical protein
MSAAGVKNQGITVWIGTKLTDPTTDTFIQISRCKLVGEYGAEAQTIDATTLEDTVKQKLKGIPDSGDIEVGGNRVYTDAGQAALKAAALDVADAGYNVRIQIPGAGTAGANLRYSFKALVTKFHDKVGSVEGLVEFVGMMAVTGAITETTF